MADQLLTADPTLATPASPVAPATTPAAPLSPAAPTAPPDWRAKYPDDIKANEGLKKFTGEEAVIRSYMEAEKYRGRSVVIPGADAKPEDREAFWAKVGRPETPDKYVLSMPEGVQVDEGMAGDFKQVAHRLGFTQEQVAGLTSWFGGSPVGNPGIAGANLKVESVRSLQAEWGGGYEHNLGVARQGARQILGKEFVELMEQTGLGNHPAVIKACHRVGKDYMEAGDIPRNAQTGGLFSAEEAQTKINDLMRSPEYARGERAAVDEVQRLFQLKAAQAPM